MISSHCRMTSNEMLDYVKWSSL